MNGITTFLSRLIFHESMPYAISGRHIISPYGCAIDYLLDVPAKVRPTPQMHIDVDVFLHGKRGSDQITASMVAHFFPEDLVRFTYRNKDYLKEDFRRLSSDLEVPKAALAYFFLSADIKAYMKADMPFIQMHANRELARQSAGFVPERSLDKCLLRDNLELSATLQGK